MIRFSLIGFILITLQLFSACDSCECDEGTGLEGFYTCSRTKTKNHEYLWLFSNNFYVHILIYDTLSYVNSDKWCVKILSRNDLFMAKNWVDPCTGYGRTYCHQTMDTVNKYNFKDYKDTEATLDFACYSALDDTCYFRLIAHDNPLYNYKRIRKESYQLSLKDKQIEFYTKRDSIVFFNVIDKYYWRRNQLLVPLEGIFEKSDE